jgi:hypothetical protein
VPGKVLFSSHDTSHLSGQEHHLTVCAPALSPQDSNAAEHHSITAPNTPHVAQSARVKHWHDLKTVQPHQQQHLSSPVMTITRMPALVRSLMVPCMQGQHCTAVSQ